MHQPNFVHELPLPLLPLLTIVKHEITGFNDNHINSKSQLYAIFRFLILYSRQHNSGQVKIR